MNRKGLSLGIVVLLVLGTGMFQSARAWFVDTNVEMEMNDSSRNTNSRNTDSRNSNNRDERNSRNRYQDERGSRNNNSINIGKHGKYDYDSTVNTNSNNRYDNRVDNRQDKRVSDSFNDYSDNRQTDSSVRDSFNDNRDFSATETVSGVKRINSSDISVGGDAKNSVLGDFNQLYNGTDFRSGVTGSGNTIDTSSVNITTLGDTLAK